MERISLSNHAFEGDNNVYLLDDGPDTVLIDAGDRMDATRAQLTEALADHGVGHFEEPCPYWDLDATREVARALEVPVAGGEQDNALALWKHMIESRTVDIVQPDICVCGGIMEMKKIAAMAEAWHLPVTPHDCTGPVVLAASTHLALNAPNALMQESVRAFLRGWYRDAVTALPAVTDGRITVPPGPGLGLALTPDLDRAFTVTRRRTDAADL